MVETLRTVALAVAVALAGCGGGWPEVVDTRSLFAGGSPSIARIRDLGTAGPPELGNLLGGEPDGVASPGEYLLIEGSGFGKQPTVAIAGRAAEVAARVAGGGIVVRVPPAVPSGAQPVAVTVEERTVTQAFPFRRLAVVVHAGTVYAVTVGAEPQLVATLPLPGAREARISADGACAYVLAGRKLVILDLGAPNGPRVINERDLAVPAYTLVAAERAPWVFAVADDAVQAFDTRSPRHPAWYDRAPLPAEAKGAKWAELDPDGRRLALLLPDGNKLVLVDVGQPREPKLTTTLALLPEARVSLVRDLRFASDGETLWVLTGDNAASLPTGTQPTRVVGVRIEGAADSPTVTPWRTSPVAGAGAPLRLALPRVRPIASATTIRMPPDKASIYFSSATNALWSAGDARAVAALFAGKTPGALDQADMAGGRGHLFETALLLGSGDFAPDGATALFTAGRVVPGAREFGVEPVTVGAAYQSHFLKLSPATDADFQPPFPLGDLRIQP